MEFRDGQMANSDVYTGWVYDGKAYVTDRFAYGRQLPAIDPADRQDIYDINGTMADDVQVPGTCVLKSMGRVSDDPVPSEGDDQG